MTAKVKKIMEMPVILQSKGIGPKKWISFCFHYYMGLPYLWGLYVKSEWRKVMICIEILFFF
jgi:hypothetical protein